MKEKMKLDLFVSKFYPCSRREAERFIKSKKVFVNNFIIKDPSFILDLKKDKVRLLKKEIKAFFEPVYFAFNKPKGVMTTASDPQNRTTIYHYLKKLKRRVFPIGRLDWSSEGLLLLTSDGVFAQKVMRSKIPKTYFVKLNSAPSLKELSKLKRGVSIPRGGRVKALFIKPKQKRGCMIAIAEGRNKQIHLMFQKIGFQVQKLKRTAIGRLKISTLKPGEIRVLSLKEKEKALQNPLKPPFKRI